MDLTKKTISELIKMGVKIRDDPSNQMTSSIFLYTPKARKKLDAIDRQIAYLISQERAAKGDPVPTCGYSGRQTKRR